ncbi:hypothetical protein DMC30DRAFT_138887 [Rhodotorula diobovata]|uniref:Uncharacterized protein n=1 Tax=Rhodotorula diobovata TaxID=5288 RepID=A0A5C5G2B6_9BASI|nr:hypothetical protein DMC30DRAFT_138887 [Rhodotorula diobovata]
MRRQLRAMGLVELQAQERSTHCETVSSKRSSDALSRPFVHAASVPSSAFPGSETRSATQRRVTRDCLSTHAARRGTWSCTSRSAGASSPSQPHATPGLLPPARPQPPPRRPRPPPAGSRARRRSLSRASSTPSTSTLRGARPASASPACFPRSLVDPQAARSRFGSPACPPMQAPRPSLPG